MPAFNFPASPTVGQTYTAGGITYIWDGVSWGGTTSPLAMANAAQWLADTAGLALITDTVWGAAAPTALTDATTIAVDLSLGINFTVTLGGNRILGNPTNTKTGQSGRIEFVQDATGNRTLSFASNWKFINGIAPSLSTAAGARDVLWYFVKDSTDIDGVIAKAFG